MMKPWYGLEQDWQHWMELTNQSRGILLAIEVASQTGVYVKYERTIWWVSSRLPGHALPSCCEVLG